jgi:threonine dehydratase
MLDVLTLDMIREAHSRIRPYIIRTPLLAHRLNDATILNVKPECLQTIGAFKIRGAFSMMKTLPRDVPGVVAHSSGNHAQAVARAAKTLGIHAVIVMPGDAPPMKLSRTRADGAEVIIVGNDSDERAKKAEEIAKERGFVAVPPYDHPLIAAGQGTAALELIEDAPALDQFYCPVSGGGLMAGCAVAFAALSPRTEIIGVEPATANDTQLSLEKSARTKIDPPKTIADGLCVRMPGAHTFPVLQKHVSRIALVSDEEMIGAIAFAMAELRVVLEPSGAASLAAALREGRGNIGVMLSGGNLDPALYGRVSAHTAGPR